MINFPVSGQPLPEAFIRTLLKAKAATLLADKAIASFKVNEANLKAALSRNPILVTALNPVIGYLKAAEIAKQAYKEGRPIIDVAAEQTDLPRDELERMQLLLPHFQFVRSSVRYPGILPVVCPVMGGSLYGSMHPCYGSRELMVSRGKLYDYP